MVGHLLYWSTLYGIKTYALQDIEESLGISTPLNLQEYEEEQERIGKLNAESCGRKKLRFWKYTINTDEGTNWAWNFYILRKKLEYNIGYFRFHQRYEGWETDVEKMVLARKLMAIAPKDYINYKETYVNIRNCERFGMKPADFEEKEYLDVTKYDLKTKKAYKLVWILLSQYMRRWWD